MTEEKDSSIHVVEGTPRWVGLAVVALAAVSVVGLAFGWSAGNRARSAEERLATETQTIQALKQDIGVMNKRLAQTEETNAQVRGELSVVTDRLKLTQGELSRARKQAKQYSDDYTKQLTEMEESVKNELASKASAEDVRVLTGDVTGIRSDLKSTQEGIQMARGELGTLIARNHEEIEQLRRLGTREYFEFTLVKKGSRFKAGEVMVELRGTNAKKGQFTMALYADDLRLEKKNRSVNEPIYFYTRGYRAPLELVVNKVEKDRVIGYISVPKGAATTAATSGN
jgi:hypothetical protein